MDHKLAGRRQYVAGRAGGPDGRQPSDGLQLGNAEFIARGKTVCKNVRAVRRQESYFYEEPSSLAEEEAAVAVSEAAELLLLAEQVVAQELPMISPRKRAAFWLMFGLLTFLVVAVSVVLMLAYFPYEQVGDVYTTVVVWNFSMDASSA